MCASSEPFGGCSQFVLIPANAKTRVTCRIALGSFVRHDGRPIDFFHAAVVITPAVAGQEREITRIGCFCIVAARYEGDVPAPLLAWSQDGNWLLTLAQDSGDASEPHAIIRASVATGEKHRLTSPPFGNLGNGGVNLSPDGKRLAFTGNSGFWARDIYVVPVSGDFSFTGRPERITFDHKAIVGIGWTGDSRYLIFSSARDGRLQLWRIEARPGSRPVRLGLTDDEVTDVAISSDGKRLIYAHDIDDQNIWQATLLNGHIAKPTTS